MTAFLDAAVSSNARLARTGDVLAIGRLEAIPFVELPAIRRVETTSPVLRVVEELLLALSSQWLYRSRVAP